MAGDAMRSEDRGHEIQTWRDRSPITSESFVIIDDASEMAHLLPWLVRTDSELGLTAGDADNAVALLNAHPY